MECIISIILLVLLTIVGEALLWRLFSAIIKKRVLARIAINPKHNFTKDFVLRLVIILWVSLTGGFIIAVSEISMEYCPVLKPYLRMKIPE